MPSRQRTLPDKPPTFPPYPDWARPSRTRGDVENATFLAGAALSRLHPIATGEHPLGSLWRQRMAMACAEAVVRLVGRTEDAATLRDHLYLTRAGDDPGPAGKILQAWRLLGSRRALRPAQWQEKLPGLLQAPADEDMQQAISRAFGASPAGQGGPIAAMAEAASATLTLTGSRPLALWLGDVVLARSLNWPAPLPLLASSLRRDDWRFASGPNADATAWRAACADAYARGAANAFDLYVELTRKAEKLLAVAPRLRGKDADEAVLALLSEDALAAQAGTRTSDRSGRRLFDRLVEFDAVRELTGRSTFRLYGL